MIWLTEAMNEPNINEAFEKPTGGYGRIFESMYKGSMLGAGMGVFAVWPYVIANMRGHPEYGALVELNPGLLAFMIGGCTTADIEAAIGKLCAPDPNSRNKNEEGRRLVKMGQFLYRVVNGGEYLRIRKAEANRQAHNEAQKRYRGRQGAVKRGGPGVVERTAHRLADAGKHLEAERTLEIERKRIELLHREAVDNEEVPGVTGDGEAPAPVVEELSKEAVAKRLLAAGLKVKPGVPGVPGPAAGAARSTNPFAP